MARCSLIALLFVLASVELCNAEVFTALATMTRALEIEKQLAQHLRMYTFDNDPERHTLVQKLADEYDRHATEVLQDAETYLANPVNAYKFVKRFTTEIPKVKELLHEKGNIEAFEQELDKHKSNMPDSEDLYGVIDALLRLQDTYEIPATKFVDGTFTPINNSRRMTASDCFEIGKHSYDRQDKYHALMWLLESKALLDLEGDDDSVDKWLLLDYLAYAAEDQGNSRHAYQFCKELLEIKPDLIRMRNNLKWFEDRIAEEDENLRAQGLPVLPEGVLPPIKNKRVPRRSTAEYLNYEALCRGEDIMPNPYEHTSVCYYSTNGNNPILILAPVKVEEIYKNPDIMLFHDVISENEMKIVKGMATPKLARAVVNDPATGKLVTAQYRISRSAWLADSHHPTIDTITKRIAAITHLNMQTVEDLQVVNYGIGGQYEPHFDHSRNEDAHQFEDWRGNRVATWIYYMSDVAAGGLTVFTEIGVKVPPVKGAAAFWWNLRKNGSGDYNTRHAGCPVLAGSKWVANKWMHIRGQEFMRPCGLDHTD